MSIERKLAAVFITYAVMGFLTFGYLYTRAEMFCPADKYQQSCIRGRETAAPMGGLWWPFYWAGRIGIELMAP